ncbi:hypothetical protein EV714DRAFT_272271 [Schizophyllum commune]
MGLNPRLAENADPDLQTDSDTCVDNLTGEDLVPLARDQNIPSALQSAYSEHAPINRLPPEIMEYIFLLCQPFYDTIPPTWPERGSLQWMSVVWVSARWRAIATAYSILWSTIELCYSRTADVARTFLERSRNAPLTIIFASTCLDFFHDDIDVLKEVGLRHGARLVTLHLTLERWQNFTHVCGLLDGQALKTKSLSVLLSVDGDTIPQNLGVDPDMLAAQLCNVRELAVGHCTCLQFGFFSGLTRLAVHNDASLSSYVVGEFWDLLQRSPELEELVLANCCILGRDTAGRRTISLPHLRRLQLSDVLQPGHFLKRLDIPGTCDMWVSSVKWRAERELASMLPPAGRSRPLQRPVHTLCLRAPCSNQRGRLAIQSGSAYFRGCSYHQYQRLAGVFDPTSRLVLVLTNAHNTMHPAGWTRLLASMPKIRTLVVLCNYLESSTSAMFEALAPQPQDNSRDLPCPALEAIHLHISCRDEQASVAWRAIERRAQAGMPLRELRVQNDRLPPPHPGCYEYTTTRRPTLDIFTLDLSGAPACHVQTQSDTWTSDLVEKVESETNAREPSYAFLWHFLGDPFTV